MTSTIAPEQTEGHLDAPAFAAEPAKRRRRRPGKRFVVAVVALAVLAAGAFFLVRTIAGDGAETVKDPSGASFKLNVPEGWQSAGDKELARVEGKPLALVRRKDGLGFVIVRREGAAPKSFEAFTRQLDREFKQRIPDFQRRSVRTFEVAAGPAFFYSYIRKKQGTANSVVIVPNGERSYVLTGVVRGGKKEAARELAQIIVSFDF